MQTTLRPQTGRLLLLGGRSSPMFIELVSGGSLFAFDQGDKN